MTHNSTSGGEAAVDVIGRQGLPVVKTFLRKRRRQSSDVVPAAFRDPSYDEFIVDRRRVWGRVCPRVPSARKIVRPAIFIFVLASCYHRRPLWLFLQSGTSLVESANVPSNLPSERQQSLLLERRAEEEAKPLESRRDEDTSEKSPTADQPPPTQGQRDTSIARRPAQPFPQNSQLASKDVLLEQDFMEWCKNAMGIQTILEIQTFDYYDYMRALPSEDWDEGSDDDLWEAEDDEAIRGRPGDTLPMIPVRGLAASRDISVGEVVIRIPLQALFSVATTIDNDPVLGPIMGPEARKRYGWDADESGSRDDDGAGILSSESKDTVEGSVLSESYVELPLLAVALLHHKRLGSTSPIASYMRILERTPTDTFPFLWDKQRLRSDVSEGIRTVARGIKRDMKDFYINVVQVLIDDHPDIFGKQGDEKDWTFSFENFKWAFAIINSRHWQLPISDLQQRTPASPKRPVSKGTDGSEDHDSSRFTEDEQLPPAGTPTELWIRRENEHRGNVGGEPLESSSRVSPHSFLAPVADLLNFGPPCTRGHYNEELRTFDIVASCSFRQGQEVTFWYSDECDHVMVGVYGFMHPIIPKCPSAVEYRRRSEKWQRRARELEQQLWDATQDVTVMDSELLRLYSILNDCADCCQYDAGSKQSERRQSLQDRGNDANQKDAKLRHDHVRGGGFWNAGDANEQNGEDRRGNEDESEDIDRHRGVRMMRRERNSEF